ncbi:hypothetical protein [Pedobacter sp.]|uniref:hypothetical protein n=1 Tax=Pedobacter sp. TaxID=1411316 RepID=UPI003D7F704D
MLPDFILNFFFELKEVRKEEDVFHLDLQEVNTRPDVPDGEKLLSKLNLRINLSNIVLKWQV